MKALLLAGMFAGLSISAHGQSIRGRVLDQKDSPLRQAAVSLLKASDSSWLRTELTDEHGDYLIHAVPGSYLVQVEAEGMASVQQPCKLQEETLRLDFRLSALGASLKEVTVKAQKPFIEAKPGMMLVNVEGSAASAGSNALELLQRSPGVQVDPQGAIAMRGRNGVVVYVDGRPSRLSGEQLTALLKSMSAEEIAQIELITQASAKYEAAGTAGIINIRTRAVRKHGVQGNLVGTATKATEWFGNLSARITYRRNKLTLYASEYFNYVANHHSLVVNRKYFDTATGQASGQVHTRQDLLWVSRFHRIKAGGEYALSDQTSIGLRAQLPIGNPESYRNNFSTIEDFTTRQTSYTRGVRNMANHWREQELGVLAKHRFGDGAEWVVDGYVVSNQGADHGLFINEETDATGGAVSAPDSWDLSFPVNVRLLSAQTDYSRAAGQKTKLETGIKYNQVAVDFSSDYQIQDPQGSWIRDTIRSTRFQYAERIAAAYASATHAFNSTLEMQAGLRAEHTGGSGRVVGSAESFSRDYLSLFPTLFVSYKPDSLRTLTISYGRRLDRPNYFQLNPARDYIDKYSYRVGNPKLLPQFVNNIELGFSWKGELTATLSAMQADGIISDFFVQDDQTKTAYEVHDNIDGYRQAGLSVNFNKAIRPWWTVNLFGDAYWRVYTGEYYGTGFRQEGGSYSCNVNNQFKFGRTWSAELSGWYRGPGLTTVFTRPAPMGSLDLAVSKKLLSDSLVVRVAVNDLLGTQRYRSTNRFANFDTGVSSTWDAQRAVLSLNYSFGRNIELMQRKSDAERRNM